MKFIGKNLTILRNYKGLTMRDLADLVKTSSSQISNYENNNVCPSIDTINRLADALDTDPMNFFNEYPILHRGNHKYMLTPHVWEFTGEVKRYVMECTKLTARAKKLSVEEFILLTMLLDKIL